jgi:hypothetical protein
VADPKPQLLNRAWREAPRASYPQGKRSHIFAHKSPQPEQASIIVYADGTVLEGWDFQPWEYDNSSRAQKEVALFIPGGHAFDCVEGDPILDILVANGFEYGFHTNYDTYLEKYTAQYPYAAGPYPADQAEARAAYVAARIAQLEAELAILQAEV